MFKTLEENGFTVEKVFSKETELYKNFYAVVYNHERIMYVRDEGNEKFLTLEFKKYPSAFKSIMHNVTIDEVLEIVKSVVRINFKSLLLLKNSVEAVTHVSSQTIDNPDTITVPYEEYAFLMDLLELENTMKDAPHVELKFFTEYLPLLEKAKAKEDALMCEVMKAKGSYNLRAIEENAIVVSQSKSGEINRISILSDEYAYLMELTERENKYKGYGDDYIELDYHSEFIPLLEHARIVQEQKEIVATEIATFKAVNGFSEEENC